LEQRVILARQLETKDVKMNETKYLPSNLPELADNPSLDSGWIQAEVKILLRV